MIRGLGVVHGAIFISRIFMTHVHLSHDIVYFLQIQVVLER